MTGVYRTEYVVADAVDSGDQYAIFSIALALSSTSHAVIRLSGQLAVTIISSYSESLRLHTGKRRS